MVDSAARAEARRRKILENSQNRLQKITGRVEEPVSRNDIFERDPVYLEPVLPLDTDHTDDASVFQMNHSRLQDGLDSLNPIFENHQAETAPYKTEAAQHTFLKNPALRIIFLSILVQAFHSFASVASGQYAFLPLVILEVTEIIFFRPPVKKSMLAVLFTMSGISPHKANLFLQVFQVITKFLEDACLYIFTIVILQLVIKNV